MNAKLKDWLLSFLIVISIISAVIGGLFLRDNYKYWFDTILSISVIVIFLCTLTAVVKFMFFDGPKDE